MITYSSVYQYNVFGWYDYVGIYISVSRYIRNGIPVACNHYQNIYIMYISHVMLFHTRCDSQQITKQKKKKKKKKETKPRATC